MVDPAICPDFRHFVNPITRPSRPLFAISCPSTYFYFIPTCKLDRCYSSATDYQKIGRQTNTPSLSAMSVSARLECVCVQELPKWLGANYPSFSEIIHPPYFSRLFSVFPLFLLPLAKCISCVGRAGQSEQQVRAGCKNSPFRFAEWVSEGAVKINGGG